MKRTRERSSSSSLRLDELGLGGGGGGGDSSLLESSHGLYAGGGGRREGGLGVLFGGGFGIALALGGVCGCAPPDDEDEEDDGLGVPFLEEEECSTPER